MGLVGAFHALLFDRSEPIPAYAFAGAYRCTECDNEVTVNPDQSPPPCLICKSCSWEPLEVARELVIVRQAAKR